MKESTQKLINKYHKKTGVLPKSACLLHGSLKEYIVFSFADNKKIMLKIKNIR